MTSVFNDAESEQFTSVGVTVLTLFASTLGGFDFGWFENHPAEKLGQAMLVIFLILVNILLLNMLIAIISTTYEATEEQSQQKWAVLNANFLLDCQNSRRRGWKYSEMTHIMPPPFSIVSVFFFPLSYYLRNVDKKHSKKSAMGRAISPDPQHAPRNSCLHRFYDTIYWVLDMMVMCTAIMLPAFLCDFTLQFMSLETYIIATYMKTVGQWTKKQERELKLKEACWHWCNLCLQTFGGFVNITLVQVLGVPLLLFIWSFCYPGFFFYSLIQRTPFSKHSAAGEGVPQKKAADQTAEPSAPDQPPKQHPKRRSEESMNK
mmetsp:Transcript_14655/g.19178  ORF Transcript_14655/g.19178 Transcript_14655/m.19178 type:complete len:318 (+) Transcript_14655:1-954(+)